MTARIPLNNPNPTRIGLLMLILLAGCAAPVKPVAHYDDILDRSVHQVESQTMGQVKRIIDTKGEGDGSFQRSGQFYAEIKGEVQALIVRAEIMEQGLATTPLTNNFEVLQLQLDDLSAQQQKPYDESAFLKMQAAFDKSFRTIVKLIIDMKWREEAPKEK